MKAQTLRAAKAASPAARAAYAFVADDQIVLPIAREVLFDNRGGIDLSARAAAGFGNLLGNEVFRGFGPRNSRGAE
ncbi:hypothetical protein [Ensifer aridi]|uniref:hypothetical protein n=1 Tax=Ensifer aridi TaxID=1708715 RepID=UPI0009C1356D|nr:hypothetical protein [Ensifer aridi]